MEYRDTVTYNSLFVFIVVVVVFNLIKGLHCVLPFALRTISRRVIKKKQKYQKETQQKQQQQKVMKERKKGKK